MLVCTTGCSGVANLQSPPQARSKRVPPSLDAPQSTLLSHSLSRSLLMPRTCNPVAVSTCTYLVVAKNNIRPPCLNFAWMHVTQERYTLRHGTNITREGVGFLRHGHIMGQSYSQVPGVSVYHWSRYMCTIFSGYYSITWQLPVTMVHLPYLS